MAYLGGLNPLASRFESGGPHRRAADGNRYTWVAQNDSLLRSNRRPRTRYDIAQSPFPEFAGEVRITMEIPILKLKTAARPGGLNGQFVDKPVGKLSIS